MPVSVNFLQYHPGNKMRIPVRIVNTENSVDLRRGCFLVRLNNFVECVCSDMNIPENIELDLSTSKKGDVFRASNLVLPANVKLSPRVSADDVLCIVKSPKK